MDETPRLSASVLVGCGSVRVAAASQPEPSSTAQSRTSRRRSPGCPDSDEWLGVVVPVFAPGTDFGFEGLNVFVCPATRRLMGHALNLVDPDQELLELHYPMHVLTTHAALVGLHSWTDDVTGHITD
ncbi:hypothetical protein [Streptomyces curacoi]|uniref:hypothetical protein n=1 Tax=Streptomyces curacoi TaxID=146536 RepID=UPI00131C04C5|nr:hypothetical protein [Streptomyces curacoi]